jgi:hypothetical protein
MECNSFGGFIANYDIVHLHFAAVCIGELMWQDSVQYLLNVNGANEKCFCLRIYILQ